VLPVNPELIARRRGPQEGRCRGRPHRLPGRSRPLRQAQVAHPHSELLLGTPRRRHDRQPRSNEVEQAPGGGISLSVPGLGDRLAARRRDRRPPRLNDRAQPSSAPTQNQHQCNNCPTDCPLTEAPGVPSGTVVTGMPSFFVKRRLMYNGEGSIEKLIAESPGKIVSHGTPFATCPANLTRSDSCG
jgi:hypothetical protein